LLILDPNSGRKSTSSGLTPCGRRLHWAGFLAAPHAECRIDGGAVEWNKAADEYYTFVLCDEESAGLTVERFEDRRPASTPR
jgi:hypothetical protein